MLLLVSDENFNNDIVRGLLRRNSDLDIVRIQDVGLRGEEDPVILEWAANEERVVLRVFHGLAHDGAGLRIELEEIGAAVPVVGLQELLGVVTAGRGVEQHEKGHGEEEAGEAHRGILREV
jgi:hypothetical protein